MITVGLTGSIGTGKSTVLNYLNSKGIPTFDADKAVHDLYAQDYIIAWVAQNFAGAIKSGAVDRRALGGLIEKAPEQLKILEEKLHPLVREMSAEFIAVNNAKNKWMAVLDIPLLYEGGREEDFDCVVVTASSDALQKQRVLERPGMNQHKLEEFLARQIPQDEKIKRADLVIWNNGNLKDLQMKTDEAIGKILAKHSHHLK